MSHDAPARLLTRATYVRELRSSLPPEVFQRAPSRLALIPLYVAIATAATLAIARGWVPWPVFPLLSIVIGGIFAGLAFVGHELLHGALLRGRGIPILLGWVCFVPFGVSPHLWIAWHNNAHHNHTNLPDDPDAFPTLETYHARPGARFWIDQLVIGGGRWRGLTSLVLGFSGQSIEMLLTARRRGFLSAAQQRWVIAEAVLALAFWATVAVLVGFWAFALAFAVPLMIGNACVMCFILTNHSLSPRVAINDPLISGLTVTTSKLVERLTLGFGYHVEHHLLPAMSTRHAPAVRALVQARWPDRYQSMPLVEALRRLHRTARVYKTPTTLLDPATAREYATLGAPRGVTAPS